MPSFPQELYGSIFQHLHYYEDKKTLLSSSRCSRQLRDESQRVLFRTVFLEFWDEMDPVGDTALTLHQAFLEAIVRAPRRLGPLVRSYNQYRVSCDVNAEADPIRDKNAPDIEAWSGQRVHVFNLAAAALYYMPNLKEFRFVPSLGDTHASLLSSTPRYTYPFQLEIFEWRYTGTTREANFTCAQRSLRHLDVEGWRFASDLHLRISPVLQSIFGGLGELCMMATGREITALDYCERNHQDRLLQLPGASQSADAVGRLKYLRLHEYQSFARLESLVHAPGTYRLVLIEIFYWSPDEVYMYHQLPPTLEILVLIRTRNNVDVSAESRRNIARTTFEALPRLRFLYIKFGYRGIMNDLWRLSRCMEATEIDGVHEEVMSLRNVFADDWWREYIHILNKIR